MPQEKQIPSPILDYINHYDIDLLEWLLFVFSMDSVIQRYNNLKQEAQPELDRPTVNAEVRHINNLAFDTIIGEHIWCSISYLGISSNNRLQVLEEEIAKLTRQLQGLQEYHRYISVATQELPAILWMLLSWQSNTNYASVK